MTVIVAATGLAGFLASFYLLHAGLETMWIRYLLAVGVSYGIFLLLLKLWIVYQKRSMAHDVADALELDPTDLFPRGRSDSQLSCADSLGRDSWTDWMSGLDGDECVAVIAILAALAAAFIASAFIVVGAPTLLGEVFLDAIVVAALRKKMAAVSHRHWSRSALRRTAIPFLLVALGFSLAGGIAQHFRPDAKSIGGILRAEKAEKGLQH